MNIGVTDLLSVTAGAARVPQTGGGRLGIYTLGARTSLWGLATQLDGAWDAILVNAGTTHPLDAWLDAVAPGGRLTVPLTYAMGGSPVGKGVVCLLTRHREGDGWDASVVGYVATFNAVGVRDDAFSPRIAAALQANAVPKLARMRRDPHPAASTCWLHGTGFCLQLG
jgi:protein-L-isoaspartate(D-aspartate) O-methyltransferase